MVAVAQRSFAGGELAPSLYGRVDQAKYASGLRTCRNFMIMRHGGATNRPGTEFIEEVKDSSKTVRLIPFIFNADQTYVLEFGNLYMRVYRDGAQVEVSGVSAWSNATAYVIGDLVSRLGVNYYCILGHTNQQPPNATYWYPLTGSVYEIPTPYVEADLPDLRFVQSADVIILVHPSYAPRELARSGHTAWTLSIMTFAPSISSPTNLTNNGTAGTAKTTWSVTAVSIGGEESLAATTSSDDSPISADHILLSWTAVADAVEYRVYRTDKTAALDGGGSGFLGTVSDVSFDDAGDIPESAGFPPEDQSLFNATGEYPSAVLYSQQRLMFANSDLSPETVWASRIGSYKNFTRRFPVQDDDPVTFTLVGRQVNAIRHLMELRELLALTEQSEWAIEGDTAGILRPTDINAKQQSYNGANVLAPIIAGADALYVQARGSIIRNLGYDYQADGYRGTDLTIFSAHMFDKYTLVDWSYQQIPHSIVWVVRDDGTLLGMTYVREQEMIAWHRHDFDGTVENVCVVPEGNEDRVYLVIRRTINGSAKRYVERMATRQIEDIVDSIFVDCALSYDGRHGGATTMTLTGGTAWDHTENLTLTASAGFFVSGDVGNEIWLTGTDGTVVRCEIREYTSATVVTIRVKAGTVPVAMRSVAISTWAKAVDEISGLSHLEGKQVAVLADGFVVASPNNEAYTVLTVTSGAITLDKPHAVIHVGLPITADLQTLDIDTFQGETLVNKKKLIGEVWLTVEDSRGGFVGGAAPTDDDDDPLEGLNEIKIRNEENYNDPVSLRTGNVDVKIESGWNSHGRVFIRQVDPLPLSVLAAIPVGDIPFRGT